MSPETRFAASLLLGAATIGIGSAIALAIGAFCYGFGKALGFPGAGIFTGFVGGCIAAHFLVNAYEKLARRVGLGDE